MAEPDGCRVLVRKVDQARDGIQGRFEAIATIVRAGVDAMLMGGRIGIAVSVSRSPRPTGASDRGETVKAQKDLCLTLAIGYSARGFSNENTLNHTWLISMGISFLRFWSVMTGYSVAPGVVVEDRETTLKFHRHEIRVGGGFDWPFEHFQLGTQVAVVAGLLDRHASVQSGGLSAAPDDIDVIFGIEAAVRVGFNIKPWLRLHTGLGVAFMIWDTDYDIVVAGQRLSILRPWPVQPFWNIELSLVLD